MKRLTIALLALLALIQLSRFETFADDSEVHQAGQVKKIGVVLPLSGGVAPIGESIRNGIVLAQAELDPRNQIQFLFDDDQFQPAKALPAIKRFLDIDKVSGLFVFGTGQGFATNHIAEQAQIPLIVMSVDPRVTEGNSFVFRFFPSIDTIFSAMLNEVQKRGYKSIALVTTSAESTLMLKAKFEAEASKLIVYNESFLPDVRDFSTTVSKIKELNPDAVGLLLMPPQVSSFARQLKEKKFSGAIFGAHTTENQAEFNAAQGALDDSWFVSAAVTADRSFFERYARRFPGAAEHYASMGYDLGKLFIEGATSSQGLNTYLHTVKGFKGAIGTYDASSQSDFDLPVEVRTGKEALARWDAKK